MVWRRSSRQRQQLRAAYVAEELAERAEAAGVDDAAHDAMTAAPGASTAPATLVAPAPPADDVQIAPGTPAAPARDPDTQQTSAS